MHCGKTGQEKEKRTIWPRYGQPIADKFLKSKINAILARL